MARDKKEFLNRLEVKTPVKDYSFKTLEGAIQQYLYAYIYESEKGNPNSYRALTSIAGKAEPGPSNRAEETSFLNALRESKEFNIMQQVGNHIVDGNNLENINQQGNTGFYHVMTKKWQKSNPDNNMRLYINPTRENLISLINEILKHNGNGPLYLKFESDNQIMQAEKSEKWRNEKIVIYSDNSVNGNYRNMINILNQIKKERPNLFDGCEIINPFMKTIDGIVGYAKNPTTDIYNELDGRQSKVAKSYNSFLAKALEESTARTLVDITKFNAIPGFDTLTTTEKIKKLLQEAPDVFISSIKENLTECQKNNPVLDIKGIENHVKDNVRGN